MSSPAAFGRYAADLDLEYSQRAADVREVHVALTVPRQLLYGACIERLIAVWPGWLQSQADWVSVGSVYDPGDVEASNL